MKDRHHEYQKWKHDQSQLHSQLNQALSTTVTQLESTNLFLKQQKESYDQGKAAIFALRDQKVDELRAQIDMIQNQRFQDNGFEAQQQ